MSEMCGVMSELTPEKGVPLMDRLKTGFAMYIKLLFVLACYTVLFVVILNHAKWYFRDWSSIDQSTDVIDWVNSLPDSNPAWSKILRKLGWNMVLFVVFIGQHSLLAERNLTGTWLHRKVFIEWKVNGSLYTLTTAVALQILKTYWNIIPIHIWRLDIYQPLVFMIHFLAWFSLYGTTLMQDMPELVGLNQVVFANHSTCSKSSKFKAMLSKQRHLGFIPFTVLICVCPVMTLDRFIYLLILVLYSYSRWRDEESYEYIKEMTSKKRTRLSDGPSFKSD